MFQCRTLFGQIWAHGYIFSVYKLESRASVWVKCELSSKRKKLSLNAKYYFIILDPKFLRSEFILYIEKISINHLTWLIWLESVILRSYQISLNRTALGEAGCYYVHILVICKLKGQNSSRSCPCFQNTIGADFKCSAAVDPYPNYRHKCLSIYSNVVRKFKMFSLFKRKTKLSFHSL